MSAVAEKKQEDTRVINSLTPTRHQLAEHGRATHLVTVESADHPQDFLRPEFWALVSRNFKQGDHVEVRDDGMTFWAEYLVLGCDTTWAKLHELRRAQLVPVEERMISPEFLVAYKGPHKKFCVIRISDQTIVHEAEQTRGAANSWLEGYARTIGSPLTRAK